VLGRVMVLRLAMLGDSIGYGIGAARVADTLAPLLVERLSATGRPAQAQVFAVPGARSSDLARQVATAASWRPDVAVVVIGANDITHLVPVEQAAAHLGGAVRSLRALDAEVVVAAAPDLSVVPHVPPPMRGVVRAGSTLLRQAHIRVMLAAGGRVADPESSTSAAFARDSRLFCSDRFHPSSAGYAVIAQALAPAVIAAADGTDRRPSADPGFQRSADSHA